MNKVVYYIYLDHKLLIMFFAHHFTYVMPNTAHLGMPISTLCDRFDGQNATDFKKSKRESSNFDL